MSISKIKRVGMMYIEAEYKKLYANAYIAYMMVGSCFAKMRRNLYLDRMYLHYAEMPVRQQYFMESCILGMIREIERFVYVQDLYCEVRIVTEREDLIELLFYTGFDSILAKITETKFVLQRKEGGA